jgi:hypothetical protein
LSLCTSDPSAVRYVLAQSVTIIVWDSAAFASALACSASALALSVALPA